MIWNLLCLDHLFTSAILLYHSNHSLGSSASVSPNSVSLTWFASLSIWFIPRFALVSAFTNAATFGFNPSAFPPGGGLKPPPSPPSNPDSDNGGGNGSLLLLLFPGGGLLLLFSKAPNPSDGSGDGLLLLLFLGGRLLLLFPKALNPPSGFAPIVPKCEKCPPPVFRLLVVLFC